MRGTEKEIRCGVCNKMLAKGMALDLTIKCPRCGTMNHVRDAIPGSESPAGHRSFDERKVDSR